MRHLMLALSLFPTMLSAESVENKEFEELLPAYYYCDQIGIDRLYTADERTTCTTVYQIIKLSFVDGVDFELFGSLSAKARSEANTSGYLAFKGWEQENANVVGELKQNARDRLNLERQSSV